jgi:hypothetical protein
MLRLLKMSVHLDWCSDRDKKRIVHEVGYCMSIASIYRERGRERGACVSEHTRREPQPATVFLFKCSHGSEFRPLPDYPMSF